MVLVFRQTMFVLGTMKKSRSVVTTAVVNSNTCPDLVHFHFQVRDHEHNHEYHLKARILELSIKVMLLGHLKHLHERNLVVELAVQYVLAAVVGYRLLP